MEMIRVCMECRAEVYVDGKTAVCERGHPAKDGWYIVRDGSSLVVGLGHDNLPGFLPSEWMDLAGYVLLGTLRRPQIVVDLSGHSYATQGRVKDAKRVAVLSLKSHRTVRLPPWLPVRPLPRTTGSPALLRALWRASHEERVA